MSSYPMRFALLALLTAILKGVSSHAESIVEPLDPSTSSRSNYRPTSLLSFDAYKDQFRKNYGTPVEEQVRQKLYLARAIKAFTSVIDYKHGRSDTYLKVNHMSDWTAEERNQVLGHSVASKIRQQDNVRRERILESTEAIHQNLIDTSSDDQVYVDHRRSGCFFKPRDQGKCGSCYIFVTVPAYEWKHCMDTGEMVAFSEQFILDCGNVFGEKRKEPPNWSGCNGGREFLVMDFVREYGLDLRHRYPYRYWQDDCPFAEGTNPSRIGYLKLPDIERRSISWDKLEETLQDTPIIVSVIVTLNFQDYGGGIESGEGCEQGYSHGILLIGHGRENGIDYWIFRNSFGTYWGEHGHYRLAKDSDCLIRSHPPLVLTGSFNTSFVNPHYDERKMRQHYRKYLVQGAKARFTPEEQAATPLGTDAGG